jgi:L-asparaginase II
MTLLGARAFTKTGAEGVFCAALPELGLGIAVKADDGATRAAETAIAALIARFLSMDEAETSGFGKFVAPTLTNWRGIDVGTIRAVGVLASTAKTCA